VFDNELKILKENVLKENVKRRGFKDEI